MSESPARSAGFDASRVPRGAWISAAGAVVLVISVFLDWYSGTAKVTGLNLPTVATGSVTRSVSGHDATDVAWIVFFLALIGLVALIIEFFVEGAGVTLPYPAWLIAGVCGVLSVLLVLFRIVDKPGGLGTSSGGTFDLGNGAKISVSVGTSFGIWLALLAAIAMAVGAYMLMNEQGTAAADDAHAATAPPPPVDTTPQTEPPADTLAPPPPAETPPPPSPPDPPSEGSSTG